ncbi:MAG: cytochrome c oxidase assembly protein [Chloroflexi bacterium]|nr:cytochrome c oxidase assembly protein [Chloroflexota bacterium]
MGIWLTGWHWHADQVTGIGLLLAAYLWGVGPLRRRYRWAKRVEIRRVAAFLSALVVLFVAIASPIHVVAEQLFSFHMLQHVLLVLGVAPLLLVGTPGWLLRPLLRFGPLLHVARLVTHPVVAFGLFSAVFALWHVPALYDLATAVEAVHIWEHMAFLVTGVMVWWPIMGPLPELHRLSDPGQMLYLVILSVSQTPLFAFITFSGHVLYPWYAGGPRLWGLSALADQQLSGVIMKVPFLVAFVTLLAVVFFRWFSREEEAAKEDGREQPGPVGNTTSAR